MGQKDLKEKNLEFYPDVFADVCNALLYEGKAVVKEEDLQSAPTETLYHGIKGDMRNQFHDVSKYFVRNGIIKAQYTLENETRAKRRMVLRKAGYEGAVYREQLDKREIYPVIGVVLYWGKKRWRVPGSLHELLGGHLLQTDESNGVVDIHDYVDDIRLHVFEMAHLPEEVRSHFKSDMRIVVDCLTEGADYVPTEQKIRHPEAMLLLLEALTGDAGYSEIVNRMMKEERKGGNVTMCELLDKYRKSGIEQGIERGEEKAILSSIKNLMKNLQLTVNQAMEALGIPPEKQGKYLQML